MHNHPAFFAVLLDTNRLEDAQAKAGTVSGELIDMEAAQAVGAMVADAAIFERLHQITTVSAGKGIICSLDCKPTRHITKNAALSAADKKDDNTVFIIRQVYASEYASCIKL